MSTEKPSELSSGTAEVTTRGSFDDSSSSHHTYLTPTQHCDTHTRTHTHTDTRTHTSSYGLLSDMRCASRRGTRTARKLPSAVKIKAERRGDGPHETALMAPCFQSCGLLWLAHDAASERCGAGTPKMASSFSSQRAERAAST